MAVQPSVLVSSRIIEDFIEKLEAFGFDRFYYCIMPDDELLLAENSGENDERVFEKRVSLKKMRCAVASDPEILKFREEFLHRFARSDEGFARSVSAMRKRPNPFIWPENSVPVRRRRSFEQFLNLYRIKTRASFYHPVANKRGWFGFCNLFSAASREEVLRKVAEREVELQGLLQEYSEMFNALAFRSINPISNFGVLSPTCVQILSMVAEGNSSEEISQRLYMSERGVNYHIDRARDILGARNRTNLVSKAYQKGLL